MLDKCPKCKSPDIARLATSYLCKKCGVTIGIVTEMFKTSDNVNNPDHYMTGGIAVIDYIKAKLDNEGFVAYCMGNVMKYTSRYKHKNGKEDLLKAQKYLGWAIENLQDTDSNATN